MIGLVSHGSSETNAANPCVDLQTVARTLYGICAQTEVYTAKRHYKSGHNDPELNDLEIVARLDRLAAEIIWLSKAINRDAGN